MVGVAGKSKGCITCRRRRIKCDESKPTCKRCEKSGYACAGYITGLQFVNTSTAPFLETKSQSSPAVQYFGGTPVKVAPRIRASIVPTELSLIAFQADVCLSFMLSNFVWRTYGTGWIEPAAQGHDPLSSQSVKALSGIFFGVSHHQEEIRLKACLQYGRALSLLRTELAQPRRSGIENLITPILMLLMHASYEEDQGAAVSHVKGLIMLLRVAGPYRFQKDPVRRAFESARATLVTSFLIARQPLFLASNDWKTVPWMESPAIKSQQNQLVDILVDVPGFIADDDKLKEDNNPTARENLLQRVKSSLYSLHYWRYTWEMMNPNACYETMPTSSDRNERVIPRRLHIRTHGQAAELLLYNAVHMWLIGLILRLAEIDTSIIPSTAALAALDAGFPDTFPRSPLRLPDDTRSLRDPAVEICRIFEFQITDPERNKDTNLFFLFPLGIAWPVLEHEERYKMWIREMLDKSPVTSGYAIGRSVWFSNYYLPKVFKRRKKAEAIF